MKNALLLFVLATSAASAQVNNRVSLELGTMTVWLGMDKAVIKQRIEASGMTSDMATSTSAIVLVIDSSRVYTLQFAHDKLTFAERNWLRDESNALPSVMDALAALIDEGATNCT